jgi:hypothetical protein
MTGLLLFFDRNNDSDLLNPIRHVHPVTGTPMDQLNPFP